MSGESGQLVLSPLSADPIQGLLETLYRGAAVLDKFTALQVVQKLLVLWVQHAPRDEKIQLTSPESAFNGRRIFEAGGNCGNRGGLHHSSLTLLDTHALSSLHPMTARFEACP